MKKIILFIVAIFVLSVAVAQIGKKTWLIGAAPSLGINSYSFKGSSALSVFTINSKAGYFVSNNFAVGLNLGLINLRQSGNSERTSIIGAFARYYLPKNIFFGSGINSVSTSASGGYPSSSSTTIPFELGIAAFITKNIAIEPSFSYIVGDSKGGATYGGMDTGANSSIGLNVGVTLYL